MSNFDCLGGKPGFAFLRELVARVLAFQRDQSRLKRSSITLDIAKNLRRGRTVIVQCLNSNSSKFKQKHFKYK